MPPIRRRKPLTAAHKKAISDALKGRHRGRQAQPRQKRTPQTLPEVWNDFETWHNAQWADRNIDYPASSAIQTWGNVEEYLRDRHGIDPYDRQPHPVAVQASKLHSLAQGRGWMDGFGSGTLEDSDLLTGAALGLLKIRRNAAGRVEAVDPDDDDD